MFLCVPHQSLMMRQAGKGTTPHLKNAALASQHDSREIEMLDEDSERSSVVDYIISPTLASQVLAVTWQCDMWLHVAYDVYLVMLLIRVNCIFLVNTLYL